MKRLVFFPALLFCFFGFGQKRKIILPDGHSLSVIKVKADRQGKYLYTLENQKCIMWDLKTGHQLYTFYFKSDDYGQGLDISPDGTKLVIAKSGPVYLFNTITGEQIAESKTYMGYEDVSFSEDGKYLYALYRDLDVLSVTDCSLVKTIKMEMESAINIWTLPGNQVLVADENVFRRYDINTGEKILGKSYNDHNEYKTFEFLPVQQLLVCVASNLPVDFYDINNGSYKGSIYGMGDNKHVTPSANTNEILIAGRESGKDSGMLALYSTETLERKKICSKHSERGSLFSNGYFDGKNQMAYLVANKSIAEFNLAEERIKKVFTGIAAEFGSDTFNPMEYNYATGRLHINTDDNNLKTIDLYRMVPIAHSNLGVWPEALSVSPTGDTAAIFDYHDMTIKNIKTGKIIRPKSPVVYTAFLQRNCFFFSNDGKQVYYGDEVNSNIVMKRINMASGIKETLFTVKGFGRVSVTPDKTMMVGFESAYELNVASVWNLALHKKIFSKPMATDGEYESQFAALSADKKNALFARNSELNIYDIQTGKPVVEHVNIDYIDKFGACGVTSDLSIFVSARRDGELTAYNTRGGQLYDFRAHNTGIRRVLFSPDNKIMYTISDDNTIKVWDTKTGKFIGVLYLFKDSNDFVFMDNEGRFDGSPDGIKKIYSVLNQKEMTLDKVFEKYYTPNLYARAVAGEIFSPIEVDIIKPVPKVKISYAAVQRNLEVDDDKPLYQNTTGVAEITIKASAPEDIVDEIRLFHNGKTVNLATRNLFVTDDKSAESEKKYVIELLPGINNFRAIALNEQRTESNPDEIDVEYKNNAPGTVPSTPSGSTVTSTIVSIDRNATMFLVVVGINRYDNPSMRLNYALADATSFKSEVETGSPTVINNFKTYFVTDSSAGHNGIINAFKQVEQSAKPRDVFIFYYAGHGVIGTDKEFYLVPSDVSNLNNVQEELHQKGIASKLLQQYAINIQAQKQLFVLDACQSAGAFATMLANDGNQQKNIAVVARSTGTHWIAASGAQQFANEFSQLGHGAFTYVLLQALKGQAVNNKMVTVNGLKNYLQVNVPDLMKKYNGTPQYPASFGYGSDFPIELIK